MDSQRIGDDVLNTGDVTPCNSSRENQLWYHWHEPGSEQLRPLKEILEKLKVNRECYGYVVDGDMACDLDTYSGDLSGNGERLGTEEFMSPQLLRSISNKNPNYLQSPVDDLLSFYFVSQWAAVFHPVPEPHLALINLRGQIRGKARGDGTTTIRDTAELDQDEYGIFLPHCLPVLQDWYTSLANLRKEWERTVENKLKPAKPSPEGKPKAENLNLYSPEKKRVFCIQNFLAFAIRGVADFGEILVQQGIDIGSDIDTQYWVLEE